MTTLSSISAATSLMVRPAVAPPATLTGEANVSAIRPSSTVSLGNPAADVESQTYSQRGLLPGQEPALAWENTANDAVTRAMTTNFGASSPTFRFAGLGSTLISQFARSGADISQSVLNSTAAKAANPGELKVDQSLLHSKADNQISLSIKTASGKTVTFSLASQDDGLGVQAKVEGGDLSAAELKEIGKLGEAFQGAIDGLTAKPPKLELSKLTQFDTSVLSSVDLSGKLKVQGGQNLTLAFHADSQSRSTRMSGPAGEVNVSVDLKNTAILGGARQQAQALKSYLAQFDKAQARGNANAELMAIFKDAFTAMNSNYVQGAKVPEALTRNPTDLGMLTGLADFKASISQAIDSPNKMRPAEVDSFDYKISQKTRMSGSGVLDRNVNQVQQSSLSASYHQDMQGSRSPAFGTDPKTQNYLYVQINDKASSSASIGYKDGLLSNASVTQTASQNTRTQKYVMGKLVDDKTVPKEATIKRDYLVLLEFAARESKKSKDALEVSSLKDALENMHQSVMLQDDPDALTA